MALGRILSLLLCLFCASLSSYEVDWEPPVTLSGVYDILPPQVAVNGKGDAVAVWTIYDGIDAIVQSSTRAFGEDWSPAIDISAPVSGPFAGSAQVAINDSGNVVAVWIRFNGGELVVQSSTFTFGGSWSAPVDVSLSGQNALSSQVAINENGNIVASWIRYNGSENIAQAATSNFGGSWSVPVDLSAPGANAVDPNIGIDEEGNAVAV